MGFTPISLPDYRPAGTTFFRTAWDTSVGGATLQGIFDNTHSISQYLTQNTNNSSNTIGLDFGPGASYTITRVRLFFANVEFTDREGVFLHLQRKATAGSYVGVASFSIHRWRAPAIEYVDFYHLNITNVEGIRITNSDAFSRQRLRGVIFYIGDFDSEEEREAERLGAPIILEGEGATVVGNTYRQEHPPSNVLSHNLSSYYAIPHSERQATPSITIQLPEPRLVNYIVFHNVYPATNTTSNMRGAILSVSDDGVHFSSVDLPILTYGRFDSTSASPPNWHGHYYYRGCDLRFALSKPYSHFKFIFTYPDGTGNPDYPDYRVGFIGLFRLGRWAIGSIDRFPYNIFDSSTWPMLIADLGEPRTCEAYSGLVTSGEEGEELYLNRITREPIQVEGYCGAIAGEYDWEEEDFYIEREISVQAYISPFADFPMLARDMHGLAGFGRQGHGDITIERTMDAATGEFGLMSGDRSSYSASGHVAPRGFFERPAPTMGATLLAGVSSASSITRGRLQAEGFVGANATAVRTFEFEATSLHGSWSSLDASLPSRGVAASCTVTTVGTLEVDRSAYEHAGFAIALQVHQGGMTAPARNTNGLALVPGVANAEIILQRSALASAISDLAAFGVATLPGRRVTASGETEAVASGSMVRTPLRMAGFAIPDAFSVGSISLPVRHVEALAADVGSLSSGEMRIPAFRLSAQAVSGISANAQITIPARDCICEATASIVAFANFWRTNYSMTGKTRGNRFDNFILKYEARP